ncbi:MAG: hypothetical protein JXL97_13180 [Bacteroidales bacterium]|nr:hypothetical protein [Bacteroidales bacterium]
MLILFVGLTFVVKSQPDEVNPNGYNVFYYPNGFKLSEGNLKDGKPDGYWITYHVNGNKKSEGNRKNFMLDSVWTFYQQNGDTSEIINYNLGQKNGFYFKFQNNNDTLSDNFLESKELYVDDKKQGFSYYYYPSGKIKFKAEYVNNNKHGNAYEYAQDGTLTAIEEYRYGNLVSRKAVNRLDKNNQKTGNWVEVFDNGKVKSEINFVSGMPNGSYKEYSPTGKILKFEKYENGKMISSVERPKYDTLRSANIKIDKEYYSNGRIKSIKNYKDSLAFGTHIFYNPDGTIQIAIEYNDLGLKSAEGILDSLSNKQGSWEYFFDDETRKALGEYKDDKKIGEWIYYYESGKIMQKGTYDDNLPDGKWSWFYEDESVLRVENYFLGARSGLMYELSPQGDTVVKGKFDENDEIGKWIFNIGDEYQEGEFYFGQKTGTWKTYYFPEMRLKSIINYSEGKKQGKYKAYYMNKKLQEMGSYASNEKNGKWSYFYNDGSIDYSITYNYGEIIKVNDEKIK